jgi:hypothetical protein
MARFDDWVTDPQLKLNELLAFSADAPGRIGVPYLGKYLVWESSGTSHQLGIFVQDAQAMAVYDALESLRRSAPQLEPIRVLGELGQAIPRGAVARHSASWRAIALGRADGIYRC